MNKDEDRIECQEEEEEKENQRNRKNSNEGRTGIERSAEKSYK
jgi:hypothetical protein